MVLTKKQLQIFSVFKPFKELTYREIKGKEKSNNLINSAIKAFKEHLLINERKINNSKLYSLNPENAYLYLEILARMSLSMPAKSSLKTIIKEIDKREHFYSLIIFGSYAENKQKANSDMDIAIIVQKDKKNAEIALNSAENKSLINLDYHIITEKELKDMLEADYENIGKEIARNHIAYYNSAIFYKILCTCLKKNDALDKLS